MKQNIFIITALIFSCTTSYIETALAFQISPAIKMIDIYVRRDENTPPNRTEPLIFVGAFTFITSVAGQDIAIQVDDQRTNTLFDTRRGRTKFDQTLTANLLYPITSEVIIF